jgi:hypothetical protein
VNHADTLFCDQIQLSVNGSSLKYVVDTSVADNSKTVFIAPPVFTNGAVNPFADDSDRIVLVSKDRDRFDLAALMGGISREAMFSVSRAVKDKLREDAGMGKKKERLKILPVNHHNEEVLTNPDKVSITVSSTDSAPYIRCNINGGDSGA